MLIRITSLPTRLITAFYFRTSKLARQDLYKNTPNQPHGTQGRIVSIKYRVVTPTIVIVEEYDEDGPQEEKFALTDPHTARRFRRTYRPGDWARFESRPRRKAWTTVVV